MEKFRRRNGFRAHPQHFFHIAHGKAVRGSPEIPRSCYILQFIVAVLPGIFRRFLISRLFHLNHIICKGFIKLYEKFLIIREFSRVLHQSQSRKQHFEIASARSADHIVRHLCQRCILIINEAEYRCPLFMYKFNRIHKLLRISGGRGCQNQRSRSQPAVSMNSQICRVLQINRDGRMTSHITFNLHRRCVCSTDSQQKKIFIALFTYGIHDLFHLLSQTKHTVNVLSGFHFAKFQHTRFLLYIYYVLYLFVL